MLLDYVPAIHSFLEIWPISSSWHLEYFFLTSKETIASYHFLLLPIISIMIFFNRKKFFFNPFYIFCLLCSTGGIYVLKALKFIPNISVDFSEIHFIMGIVLIIISLQQFFNPSLKKIDPLITMLLMSITQSFNIMIPGLSRWGCSLFPFLFIQSDYKTVFWQTLFLDFLLLIAGCLKDSDYLLDIHLIDLYYASAFFLVSSMIALRLGWLGIFLSGIYRLVLGFSILRH